jgi:hypothetical protein
MRARERPRRRRAAAAPLSSVMNSLDHLVGAGEQHRRDFEIKGLSSLEVDD